MRRLALSAAVLGATLAFASSGTYSAFTDTEANTAVVQTQAIFPPFNTAKPTTTTGLIALVTNLIGGRGTWTTADTATTSYTLQWQRQDSGVWGDVGSSLVLTSGILGNTLAYPVLPTDSGKQFRLKVTAVDSAITSGVSTTVAYSDEVTG